MFDTGQLECPVRNNLLLVGKENIFIAFFKFIELANMALHKFISKLLSAESEELNRALVLTIARAMHITSK